RARSRAARQRAPSLSTCVVSFALRLPPPPNSTLFPYTTLFRSPQQFRIDPEPAVVHRPREQRPGMPGRCSREVARHLEERVVAGDRKSTRLNSSHVSIPYAVFGFKKKKR